MDTQAALGPPAGAEAVEFGREASVGRHLRMLFGQEDYAGFQALLDLAIDRLPDLPDPGRAYVAFLLRFAERACLPPARIDVLLDALRPRAQRDAAVHPTWRAVAARQVFRRRLQGSLRAPLTLVSLGLHCLPWTLVNRWGFRTPTQFAALHNPFCLAVHRPETVVQALAEDFAGYADPADLRETTTPQGHRIAMRRDGGAMWNHNRGAEWLDPDFAPLRAALAQKADAFRESCTAEGVVFLLGDCRADWPAEPIPFLADLRAALARMTGQPASRLVLTSQGRRGGQAAQSWVDPETAWLSVPYPHPRYTWADDDVADSPEGLLYERGYATALLRCLQQFGLADRLNRTEAASA